PGQGGEKEDAALWAAAQPARFAGTTVCVPRCEDRIALALAHGGLDGHTHSDWLVDCALILRTEMCDWQRLQEILLARQLSVPAAITFHYLRDVLEFEIPAGFLAQLSAAATHRPFAMYSGLIQARPKDRVGLLGQVLRGLAKKQRKVAGLRRMPAQIKDRELVIRRVSFSAASADGAFVGSYRLERLPQNHRQVKLEVDIVLDVQTTATRRRIEMEINSASSHLARIRFRNWVKTRGPLRLRVSGTIVNPSSDETLELVSRPSKQLRRYASTSERERYGNLPFRVISYHIRQVPILTRPAAETI
ncbi:MAG: hypothetical protein WAN65_31630, partial [Candidatus Sulfotelmatobacter sp.]